MVSLYYFAYIDDARSNTNQIFHSCFKHATLQQLAIDSMAFVLIMSFKSLYLIVQYTLDSVDGRATILWAGISGVRIPVTTRKFSFLFSFE